MKQLLLLARVSNPQYNEFLYKNHKLYMNPQLSFDNAYLLKGQVDGSEGALSETPVHLFYSTDNRISWNYLTEAKSLRKDNNAYIYCAYAITYNEEDYDKENNRLYYKIPWEYISGVWREGYEMMIIKNTTSFLNTLQKAAERVNLPCAYGMIQYDLEKRLQEEDYIGKATADPFMSVFHKKEREYSIQNEFRFAVKLPEKVDHYELQLSSDEEIFVSLFPLKHGRDIIIELSNLEFDAELKIPLRFSSNIIFYESNKDADN